jgi:hypothetical protein
LGLCQIPSCRELLILPLVCLLLRRSGRGQFFARGIELIGLQLHSHQKSDQRQETQERIANSANEVPELPPCILLVQGESTESLDIQKPD